MPLVIAPLIQRYLRLGANPGDSQGVRVGKAQLMGSASLGIVGFLVLGLVYLSYQEPEAGFVAVGCGILMAINVAVFVLIHRSLEFAFTIQAALTFLVGLMLVFVLGSFANSSGTPLTALFFVLMGGRYARFWFLIYVPFLIAVIFAQPFPRDSINVPPFVVSLLWLINLSVASGVLLALYRYAVAQRNNAYRLLRGEQERAENLLLNILPKDIAAVLKNQPRTIAEHFDSASILFADAVNFTSLSTQMAPVELVEMLNEVFSEFDVLVEKYGLEKSKTIGDCYMVAAGVPRTRPDHAQALTRMALEMQAFVATREFHQHKLAFRIGINSGPVVAGVIGRKKFSYDLWGDAVNTASRMESHGMSGTIQITRATYELVKDEFICEPRGTVHVKGKGEMEIWHVTGAKPAMANPA
jgi:adenylate cyclase